jgi:hypothetical protein
MDDLAKLVAVIYIIVGAILLFIVAHATSYNIYSNYCSYHKMEYNSNLDACVDRENGMIMEIEWRK